MVPDKQMDICTKVKGSQLAPKIADHSKLTEKGTSGSAPTNSQEGLTPSRVSASSGVIESVSTLSSKTRIHGDSCTTITMTVVQFMVLGTQHGTWNIRSRQSQKNRLSRTATASRMDSAHSSDRGSKQPIQCFSTASNKSRGKRGAIAI